MFIVGLTGGIGSGKTAVSDTFKSLGVDIIDADVASRIVVEKGQPALRQIAEHFGKDILQEDGTLDRALLREKVFAEPKEREWLERLLHPLIYQTLNRLLSEASSEYAILVSPLLVETGQNKLTQRILVVDVPEQLQIERAVARDNNNEQQVRAIIAAQASRNRRLAYADDVITNDQDISFLHAEVKKLHLQYLQMAKSLAKK
ncbi:dephospho-CoA kinase [Aurantivibrio infirmus]